VPARAFIGCPLLRSCPQKEPNPACALHRLTVQPFARVTASFGALVVTGALVIDLTFAHELRHDGFDPLAGAAMCAAGMIYGASLAAYELPARRGPLAALSLLALAALLSDIAAVSLRASACWLVSGAFLLVSATLLRLLRRSEERH
jgi:hypothetical protein